MIMKTIIIFGGEWGFLNFVYKIRWIAFRYQVWGKEIWVDQLKEEHELEAIWKS